MIKFYFEMCVSERYLLMWEEVEIFGKKICIEDGDYGDWIWIEVVRLFLFIYIIYIIFNIISLVNG